MPNRIHVLSEQVANMIAAGEVVERPAAVVKELVENSIDAGSQKIIVDLTGAGINLIRITDDGEGMSEDEAKTAILRHATSKIRDANDLFSISSYGFRGEALPSIASVSRLELVTRPAYQDSGMKILIEAGRIIEAQLCGCPVGTRISVKDLFYNTPARKKFLKAPSTELSHITDFFRKIAVVRHAIHFILRHNGRELLNLPPSPDKKNRIREALGGDFAQPLFDVSYQSDLIKLAGYYVSPRITSSNRNKIFTFVNDRFIVDKTIIHAVSQAFHKVIPENRYPLLVLFLEMAPHFVDVNVHPAKKEVRFQDTNKVHQAILSAFLMPLRASNWAKGEYLTEMKLGEAGLVANPDKRPDSSVQADLVEVEAEPRELDFSTYAAATLPTVPRATPRSWDQPDEAWRLVPTDSEIQPAPASLPEVKDYRLKRPGSRDDRSAPADSVRFGEPRSPGYVPPVQPEQFPNALNSPLSRVTSSVQSGAMASGIDHATPFDQPTAQVGATAEEDVRSDVASIARPIAPGLARAGGSQEPLWSMNSDHDGFFSQLNPLGQLKNLYILIEGPGGLVIIDQHAAHERATYSTLKSHYDQQKIDIQQLLMPIQLEVTPLEAAFLTEHRSELLKMGFDIEPFGGLTFMVKGTPVLLGADDSAGLVRDMLEELTNLQRETSYERRIDLMLATIACHSSVRAGKKLSFGEMKAILRQMDGANYAAACPHGRPAMVTLTFAEIEKMFKRR